MSADDAPPARGRRNPPRRLLKSRVKDPYQVLADAVPQIVWTAEPDGYNDYFNQRWFEYTGLTEEQTYLGDDDVIHQEDLKRYKDTWATARRTGKDYEIEYRFRRASDGSFRWHLGRGTAIRNEKGDIVKWIGTCTDIHDQKMAQEKIRLLNLELEIKVKERTRELSAEIQRRKAIEERDAANIRRLQHVLESALVGAVLLDEERRVLHVNKRFCDMFHLARSPGDLVGVHGEELLALATPQLEEPEATVSLLREHVGKRRPLPNHDIRLRNGRVFTREYLPIFVEGAFRGDLLLYRDVTQEKRIDAAKSEFMSLASHQLRTPLTAIRWIFGRLRRSSEGLSQDHIRLLDEGKKASQLMSGTISTMLAISRIESGKIHLKLQDVPLHELLTDAVAALEVAHVAARQSVTVDCPKDATVFSDANFLREIMRNLIGNAVKYTPDGGTIHISARPKGKTHVQVQVRDSGMGIPREQQDKIFTKFFRATDAVANQTDGSGLGLYLVHLLVSLVGGTISFESEAEKGTIFTVLLPKTKPSE